MVRSGASKGMGRVSEGASKAKGWVGIGIKWVPVEHIRAPRITHTVHGTHKSHSTAHTHHTPHTQSTHIAHGSYPNELDAPVKLGPAQALGRGHGDEGAVGEKRIHARNARPVLWVNDVLPGMRVKKSE